MNFNQIQVGGPNDCPTVTTTAITTDYVLQEYGWICPKCGRVYSPSTTMCLHCGDNSNVIVTFPDDWLIYKKQRILCRLYSTSLLL